MCAAPVSRAHTSCRPPLPGIKWAVRRTAALPFGIDNLLGIRRGGAVGQPTQLEDSEPQLTNWLQHKGFDPSSSKLVAQQLPGQGTGLVAQAPIRQGELALAVPESLVLLPQRAAAESVLAPLLCDQSELTEQLDTEWAALALFLAEQRYRLRKRQQKLNAHEDSSEWAPYLHVLPEPPLGTVLDWSDHEVSSLLAGSGLLEKASSVRGAASTLWSRLQPLLCAARERQLCPHDMFSEDDVRWGIGICLTRSVRLDDRAGEVVLVPYADLLNHTCECDAYLVWDPALCAVVMRTDRAYNVGDQVFISYGPKSSGELLLAYGFCPPPGSNPHDAAHVTLAPVGTMREAKLRALYDRGIPGSESFSLRIDALPAGLLPYIAFCAAPAENEQQVLAMAKRLFDECDMDIQLEMLGLDALARHCRKKLVAYPQNLENDKALAASAAHGGGFDKRVALAAAIRVRERQILSRTEFVARQRARQLL